MSDAMSDLVVEVPDRSSVLLRKLVYNFSLASGKDLDSDGKPELLIGLPWKNNLVGPIVIETGGAACLLDGLSPPSGVTVHCPASEEWGIVRISGGRDLNGDGIADLVIQVHLRFGVSDSEWQVVFGRKDWPSGATLRSLPGTAGIASVSTRFLLGAMAMVPDVDGDGLDDLLLSGAFRDKDWLFIVRGRTDWPAKGLRLEEVVDGGQGAWLISDVRLNKTAGSAGDFNQDGRSDVFFGGSGVAGEQALAVLYGRDNLFSGSQIILANPLFGDASGVLLTGPAPFSTAELRGAFPGDMDRDGKEDAFFALDEEVGCSILPRSGGGSIFSLPALLANGVPPDSKQFLQETYGSKAIGLPDFAPGAPGTQDGVLHFRGQVAGEGFGLEAAPAGDFDGDGFPDLAIGAPGVQGLGPTSGSCYVIRGGAQPIPGPVLEASDLGDHGIRLAADGVPGFGRFIAGRFDWDGDGADDLLIGARGGEAYVVLGGAQRPAEFIRGDANGDGRADITDAVFVLGFLFQGGVEPSCPDAADTNDDGKLDITDAVYLLAFLFQGGREIPAPYPAPGPDATQDALPCVR